MKVLDTQALHLPVYSKGLKILWFLYFSLVLISEQTKRFGGLRDLFCHQHFELLRRQALPLPVDICHFRKPARRPRLASITSTPPPTSPSFELAAAWDLLAFRFRGFWEYESSRTRRRQEFQQMYQSSLG